MKKKIWLFISAFGIMFAVLSWLQESKLIPNSESLGYLKGLLALISGYILYLFFEKSL